MKSAERHQLKENEIAVAAARVTAVIEENPSRALLIGGAVLLAVVVAGGFYTWRKHSADEAGAGLGVARAIQQAQIAPASTLPGATQVPGTYPTEKARDEAALAAFQDVVTKFPGTPAAQAAAYEVASEYLALGKPADAETAFKKVADEAGSSVYGPMARMGVGQAQAASGKYDDAIKTFTDLAAERDSVLPVDGVLAELGRVQLKAGKTQEARATLKRVVDDFPESGYVADAKQQLAAIN
jgi:TolA-binding protein